MIKLAIVGVGKMGGAILEGVLKSSLLKKEEILLVVRRETQKNELEQKGLIATLDIKEAYEKASTLLLAVKPQKFDEVFKDATSYSFKNKNILSIAAGIKIEELKKMFKEASIFRAMPNTSALINESCTTMCFEDVDDKTKIEEEKKILESIGSVVVIKENEMDATLPLNGSMPAYIYYFIKSFIDASVKAGVSKEKAKELIANTIISSTKMFLNSNENIDTLINNVCSKGGTTIAGLNELIAENVDKSIEKCYFSCKNRSEELSKK